MNEETDSQYLARELADMRERASAVRRRRTRSYPKVDDRQRMLDQVRIAQPWEYSAWVTAYMRDGGRDFRFVEGPTYGIYVAVSHLVVYPLYGADALKIVVPTGLTSDDGETGHTDLYVLTEGGARYRGFHGHRDPAGVLVFSDTEVLD